MKLLSRNITLLLAILTLACSCGRDGRVIPPHKLARIYADMLVADQMIRSDYSLTNVADTSLFYEPVLMDYGYTTKDYVKSVGHYMRDPESFGKIFKEAKDILTRHIDELTAEERARHMADSVKRAIEASDFKRAPIYRSGLRDSLRTDTVEISLDTSGMLVWKWFMPDTIFKGPVFTLKSELDSLAAVADSLSAVADSLRRQDSLKVNAPKADVARKLAGERPKKLPTKPGLVKPTVLKGADALTRDEKFLKLK